MKLVSWNVNGIRAILRKDFMHYFNDIKPDIMCIQETKAKPEQVEIELKGYHLYWDSAVKPGYSGTLIISKEEPIKILYGLGKSSRLFSRSPMGV